MLQSQRVGGKQVSRDMPHHYGMVCRGPIEIVSVGVPPLRKQGIVIAKPEHKLTGGNLLLLDAQSQRTHNILDTANATYRRRG